MKKVGFIGWRGMVGSVLMQRMVQENDFSDIDAYFYSTSASGSEVVINGTLYQLLDAHAVDQLCEMDIIVSTQGGDYTKAVFPQLQAANWQGYWIDAASALRMEDYACIVLDPVNSPQIEQAIASGVKVFVGGNCSITLAMIGVAGLLKQDLIEWLSITTFQSASGAGAANVRELLTQSAVFADNLKLTPHKPDTSILELLEIADGALKAKNIPTANFGLPLIGNIIPWIDSDLGNGSSREEWKGEVELNKLLGLAPATIKVDGFCVRVGTLRCHSTSITMKLKKNLSVDQMENIIKNDNEWVEVIPNTKQDTLDSFTPIATSESLKVKLGRLKELSCGDNIYGLMTVGDQLLWGAAEPLRRMLRRLV